MNKKKIEEIKRIFKMQQYRFAGNHTAVKICKWNKDAIRGKGECYKYKFYGIPSWKCCQMSPFFACENKCVHCWRPIELNMRKLMGNKKTQKPKEIIEECIKEQRKLLTGFKGFDKINKERYEEAQNPSHFAISLIGEPTLYPYIGELIKELRKQGKTSFIVSNGLHPEIFKKLDRKKQLPTQIYVSLNSSNEKEYNASHNSSMKNAWKKYNQTLELLNQFTKKGKRTILRMTLVRNMNMDEKHIQEFSEIIKKSGVMFVEVKGYMALGYARARIPYESMPTLKEVEFFAKKLAKKSGYFVLDKHVPSVIVLLGKKGSKTRMKIQKNEI